METRRDTRDLQQLAVLLDSKFQLPLGISIGWDGILGMIPGVGDLITNTLSGYIIWRAAMLGCPPAVIARMGLNVLIDNLVDMLPVLGNVLDFLWKSNVKNLDLVERYLSDPRRTTNSSRGVVGLSVVLAVGFGLVSIALVVVAFKLAWALMVHLFS